ncbi:phosphoribosylformylglycinamidine synthase subunit PurQ [[Eubacterium] cellulosolvens]
MTEQVRSLVLTGYGLNCDYETNYCLNVAGAVSERVHINELIKGEEIGKVTKLEDYHIIAFDGGFSWADDHGAGIILAARLRYNIGDQLEQFINDGKLIIGICNGFQALVNLGLLPGFNDDYHSRDVALTFNDIGNFRNLWVKLKKNTNSKCIFTRDIAQIDLPIRHGEGKFFAEEEVLKRLRENEQIVFQYAKDIETLANGEYPENPNGSLLDIAGICDPTGRIFGLMPHPEAYNHYTSHPAWPRRVQELKAQGKKLENEEGEGVKIFRNAVEYIKNNF